MGPNPSSGPASGVDYTTINETWLDATFTPATGTQLDVASIVTPAANAPSIFTLSGPGLGTATLDSAKAPLQLNGGTTFRFFLTGSFVTGAVTVSFAQDAIHATRTIVTDPAHNTTSTMSYGNLASTDTFQVGTLTGTLTGPLPNAVIDAGLLNNRGYIDVPFAMPAYASTIDTASVTDLDPEFTVAAPAGKTFTLDNTQAPVFLGQTTNAGVTTFMFRYWYTGTFAGSTSALTLTYINQSYNWLDASGGRINNFADFQTLVQQDSTRAFFINVPFGDSAELNASSVTPSALVLPGGFTGSSIMKTGPPGNWALTITGTNLAAGQTINVSYASTQNDATKGIWTYTVAGQNSQINAVIQKTQSLTVATSATSTWLDVHYSTFGSATTNVHFAINPATLDGNDARPGRDGRPALPHRQGVDRDERQRPASASDDHGRLRGDRRRDRPPAGHRRHSAHRRPVRRDARSGGPGQDRRRRRDRPRRP